MKNFLIILLLIPLLLSAQEVKVEEYVLDNGMKFLLYPREGSPNIACGWVARVGSVNERPGITGLSHLFEHMMFKGTHVIGTKDYKKDQEIIARLDELKDRIFAEERELQRRFRLGEVDDLKDPKYRSKRHNELLAEFDELLKKQKELIVKDEMDRIYTRAGASGLNAGTSEDWTIYFINVPSNKLELWAWLESDRLMNPVFREFYSERDVVHEERRLRVDSTPTGRFEEEFNAMFWTASPYNWQVIGWPSDLEAITRREAKEYFGINYAPNNIVACLVGDFKINEAKEIINRYFSRLKRNPVEAEPVRTREVEQLAEKRMIAWAETNPKVVIRYHSVADGHRDEPALLLLGSLMNGRTGRLYKSLILEQEVANSASAGQYGLKYAGYFTLSGTAKPGHTPEEVEKALYAEINKFKDEFVGERELQKVKNQWAAGNFRRLESSFYLMFQLLINEAYNGWEQINESPKKIQAVTAEDIQRVAKKYFKKENRAVAVYYTKEGTQEDPMLAGLDEEEKQQVRQFKGMLSQARAEQLKKMLAGFEQRASNAPEEKKDMIKVMKKMVEDRLKALEGGKQ